MAGTKIPVMEVFGPTIEGEGAVIGRKTMFLRTGGCDFSCSWCDSKFTWDGSQKATMMTSADIIDEMCRLAGQAFVHTEDNPHKILTNFDHITISGGNPALIGDPMADFINLAHHMNIRVGLETQGSKWQDWFWDIDDLTLSPKPPSSGMAFHKSTLDNIISRLYSSGCGSCVNLKIVVFDDEDFAFAKQLHKWFPVVPMFLSVGNYDSSEEGDISGRLLDKLGWLFDKVTHDPEMNDVRPLPQLHTLVWYNKRGV